MSLAEHAARTIAIGHIAAPPLETAWLNAALLALATGRRDPPPIETLKPLTVVPGVWAGIDGMVVDMVRDRIARLRDCHHLAITVGDAGWLIDLRASWAAAPPTIGDLWPLRGRIEIALGLQKLGHDADAWSLDDLTSLVEESILRLDAPSDAAWWALATGNVADAEKAIAAYEQSLSAFDLENERDPEIGLRHALGAPGATLRVELRALRRLAW